MSDQITSFEDLECWQACRRLSVFIATSVTPLLPKEERYGLTAQMLRSARSATANIAEGYGRFHYNARGSCFETLDHLITANDEDLISGELLSEGRELVSEVGKILNGYSKYLQKRAAA